MSKVITTKDTIKTAQEMGLTGVLMDEYVRAQGVERHWSRTAYVASCYSAQDDEGKPVGLAALAALIKLSEGGFGGGSPMSQSSGSGTRQLSCWSNMGTNRAHAHDAAAWNAARFTAADGFTVEDWEVNAEGWLEATVRTPKDGVITVDICEYLQDSEYECVVRFAANRALAAADYGDKDEVTKWCRIADWATLELELDAVLADAEALDEIEGGNAHWSEVYAMVRGRIKSLVASWEE